MTTTLRRLLATLLCLAGAATAVAVDGQPASLDFQSLIQPVPRSAAFSDPDYDIWCGTMLRGGDGRCHLFYSRWPRKLGHKAWVTHSEIAHAVAEHPLGPYRHVDVILPARGPGFWDGSCTHNPAVLQVGKQYVLYYMGNRGDGVVQQPLNWIHRNNQRIGVATATSLDGPWKRFDQPVVDVSSDPRAADSLMTSNPAACVRPDGSVLMVYKAVGQERPMPFGGPVVHLVATAARPEGPFTKRMEPVFSAKGVDFAAEDPFIWHDGTRFRAVVKDNSGNFTKRGYSLAQWESEDGIAWRTASHVLVTTPDVRWADGTVERLDALERPQLWFDQGRPAVLFCAAARGADRVGSFNLAIPLMPVADLR